MNKEYYEIETNFSPIFNTANLLMKARGYNENCDIIADSQISVVNTEYDNWNGGTYGYTVYVNLPIKKYASLSSERITEVENVLGNSLNEVSSDNNSYFHVKINPVLNKIDIDWNIVGGLEGKTKLKQKIETVKNIMISVATNGSLIKNEESRYLNLQAEITNDCKRLNLIYNNFYASLWDWRGKWKADFATYKERRNYIQDLFSETFTYFEEIESSQNIETFVELRNWDRIERTIIKIKKEANSAKNEEDFQTVGLLCRDIIISLAQSVYNPEIHGKYDENNIEIGSSDAVRMLKNYINIVLVGKDNKELRDYIKAANAIANQLTHKRSATKKDMLLAMSSTISLINIVGILEEKY